MTVVRYFGAAVAAPELFRRLGTGRDGTRQGAIVRVLRECKIRANVRYDMGFAELCRCLGKGKLIIGYLNDLEHWVVIYGFGLEPRRVFVADPRPDQSCEKSWQQYEPRLGGFGIVCSPAARVSVVPTQSLPEMSAPETRPRPDGACRSKPRVPQQLPLPWA